jgi:chromosome partitioning protein
MMFAGGGKWQPDPEELSLASMAIIGSHDSAWLCRAAQPATWVRNPESEKPETRQVQNLKGISAFHDLADTEDRLKLLWAIAEEKRDIRYFLYDLLHSDPFRNAFSMVWIDAPPRLTTACVQALVASTHVLIPTVMDDLSAGAVGYFGKQLRRHEELWCHLRVLGIVGSMREDQRHEKPALTAAGDALRQSLAGTRSRLNTQQFAGIPLEFPYELSVPQRAALSRTTGRGIAYAALGDNREGNDVRAIYDGLADEIVKRMRT